MSLLKVLVVDDLDILRQGTALALEAMGFEVDEADSGAAALVAVKTCQYAAIIMDYQMPEMNGFQCTAKIRDLEKRTGTRTPIICMSGNTEAGMQKACLEAGLDDYLEKDANTQALKSMILKWIGVTDIVV